MAKICIDPGHGGKDPGAVANGLKEKDLTLKISLEVARLLKAAGFQVILTRDKDIDLPLDRRTPDCNISVSIHINAGGGQGLETWAALFNKAKESQKLAECIQKSILASVPFKDRCIKMKKSDKGNWDYLYMIRKPLGIPVLVEAGFIDNPVDAQILKQEENINKIAKAIADGILKYLGIKKEVVFMGTVFKDVPDNHWAIEDIKWVKEKGLMRGDEQGNFELGKSLTREEAAAVLHRFAKLLGVQ